MKVVMREKIQSSKGTTAGVRYVLDSGHIAHIYNYGQSFVYTPKGNYASQVTMHKIFAILGDYEANRIQIAD